MVNEINGHNRYEICQKHNILFKTVEKNGFKDRDDVKIWIRENQLGRRNINAYQRSKIVLGLEELYEKRAREQHALKHTELYKEEVKVQNSAPSKKVKTEKTRDVLAKKAKVSHDTIAKVKKIEEKATPEVKKELESGTKSINEVYKEIKKEERLEERRQDNAPASRGKKDRLRILA